MGEGSLLSLRWNNHIKNFKFTLGQLLQRDLYSDATIAVEGQFYPVHKFVLSTCSDYFANMFERTPCKHPVIVLKDVSSKDIKFLLSYMYGGEISVRQADLPSLIRVAETLQIKGLVAPDDPPTSPGKMKNIYLGKNPEEKSAKRARRESNDTSLDNKKSLIKREVEEGDVSLSEDDSRSEDQLHRHGDKEDGEIAFEQMNVPPLGSCDGDFYDDCTFPEVKQEEREEFPLADFLTLQEGDQPDCPNTAPPEPSESSSWSSSYLPCTPTSNQNNAVNNSVLGLGTNPLYPPREASDSNNIGSSPGSGRPPLITPSHPCPMCPKKFQSRADVVRHLRTHTGEKPYRCPHCEYRAALKGNLKSHILSRHPHDTPPTHLQHNFAPS